MERQAQFSKPIPVLLVITGPSGCGKTTVSRTLLQRCPSVRRVVTCTTRPKRSDEVDGQDYYFLTRDDFINRLNGGELIEHAEVYGHYYGVPKKELIEQLHKGYDLVLTVDVQGVRNLIAIANQEPQLARSLVTIFMTPPTLEELKRRLLERGSESEASLKQRLARAISEIQHATLCDYLLISTTREQDAATLEHIYIAERCRSTRSIHRLTNWELKGQC